MLTVQSKILNYNYSPVFKASDRRNEEIIDIADMDEDTYESARYDLEDQRDNFNELAESSDFKMPKPAKQLLKGGAVLTTGLLGGMAGGWGAKKSIEGFAKLAKTQHVRSKKKHFKAVIDFIKDSAKTIKAKFKESDAYKMPANYFKKQKEKFASTEIGKPVVNFFSRLNKGLKEFRKDLSNGLKKLYNKIRGVKKETWEKGTVNTVGVSTGIASGAEALKKQDEGK